MFDRPKPTTGCSANGRRRIRTKRRTRRTRTRTRTRTRSRKRSSSAGSEKMERVGNREKWKSIIRQAKAHGGQ